MTLAQAVEQGQWDVVALLLLLGVSEAASKLPPESLAELLDLIAGEAEEGGRGGIQT